MSEMTESRSIETITAEILVYKAQAGAAILEIGRRLIEAKEQLEHGEWLPWLENQVDFTERAAQRFMRLAREYSNPTLVSDLGCTKALVLLAVPEEERETFAREVDAEHCTAQELREAIKARDEAINQAKGWALKCESAKADADAAREAAAKREEELKSRPVEVATKDAAPEQIEAAKAEGRAEAEQELAALRAKLASQPMADATARAVAEINVHFAQIQTAAAAIRQRLGDLDDITRAKVTAALGKVLREVG